MVSQGHVTNKLYIHYESTMANKRGRMMTYLDGLLPIKSDDDPLITWSNTIT